MFCGFTYKERSSPTIFGVLIMFVVLSLSLIKARQAMWRQVTLWCVRASISTVEKQKVFHIVCVCVCVCVCVALFVRHGERMRNIIFSSAACMDVPYFSTLSHKQHDLQNNVTQHKMCVVIFSVNFI